MPHVARLAFLLLLLSAPVLAADDSSDIHYPTIRRRVEPEAPALYRNNSVAGKVEFQVMIGIDGAVEKIETLSCTTRRPGERDFSVEPKKQCVPFEQAGRKAVSQWIYEPATQRGKPIEVWITVTFDFRR